MFGLAFKTVLNPLQKWVVPETVVGGNGFTVIDKVVAVLVQPKASDAVTATLYAPGGLMFVTE